MELVEVKKGSEIKKVERQIVNQYIAAGWTTVEKESPKPVYTSTNPYPTTK